MIRQVIQIDEEKCNGCGVCADACHEGAIGIVNGKARLLRDDYCDGMGDCLPHCPVNAISFINREAAAYDEAAVAKHIKTRVKNVDKGEAVPHIVLQASAVQVPEKMDFALSNFPIQLKLAPVSAPYLKGADLLVAADCTGYACSGFHKRFIAGKPLVIGCPKLDGEDYSDKLAAIISANDIHSITLTRMTVPCCGGLERMVRTAMLKSAVDIPLRVVTIGPDGTIVREENY